MVNGRQKKLFACGAVLVCLVVLCFAIACSPRAESGASNGHEANSSPSADTARSDSGQSAAADEPGASAKQALEGDRGSSANAAEYSEDESGEVLRAENGAEYRADEVLVELPQGITASDLNERLSEFDFVATTSITEEDVALGWVTLKLKPGQDVAQAATSLEDAGVVSSAQPNYVYHLLEDGDSRKTAPELDGSLANGSSLIATSIQQERTNDRYTGNLAWQLESVGAYSAWKTVQANHKVTVAVIDSGCNTRHPDLKANIRDTYNVLDGSKDVSDANGHGTHVAGIVAAVPDNGLGVAGVSYNAWVLPIKVMKDDTTDTAALVKAYRYVLDNAKRYNIRVVNMSLGAEQKRMDASDEATLRAIDEAYRAGILSVFAAGNDDARIPYYCFPCDFAENGVGVMSANASSTQTGKPDSNSNYNMSGEKTKDLCAPGCNIVSTSSDGDYESMTGTSMATPVVSGVAALVFARNPSLDAGQAKSVLCSTAEDIVRKSGSSTYNTGFDDYTGYGMVRADNAVNGALSSYISGGDSVAIGSTLKLSVPQSGAWVWSSSNQSIAKVDTSTGVVTGVGHGEAVISAAKGSTTLYRTVVVYETSLKGSSSVHVGKAIALSAWANPVSAWTYSSSNANVATVGSTSGIVVGRKAGSVTITARLSACPSIKVSKRVKVLKYANPMSVTTTVKKVKYSKVKKRAQTVKGGIVFSKKAQGKVTYAKVAKGSSKKLSINKTTGKITVKKGTKRGTYKIKVKVTAAGNATYQAVSKTVTVKVRVR